jgi:hypothetical protein
MGFPRVHPLTSRVAELFRRPEQLRQVSRTGGIAAFAVDAARTVFVAAIALFVISATVTLNRDQEPWLPETP